MAMEGEKSYSAGTKKIEKKGKKRNLLRVNCCILKAHSQV